MAVSFSKCIRILPCEPHSETVGFVGFAQPTGYHCSLLVAFSLLKLKGYRDGALQVLEFDADPEQNMVTRCQAYRFVLHRHPCLSGTYISRFQYFSLSLRVNNAMYNSFLQKNLLLNLETVKRRYSRVRLGRGFEKSICEKQIEIHGEGGVVITPGCGGVVITG